MERDGRQRQGACGQAVTAARCATSAKTNDDGGHRHGRLGAETTAGVEQGNDNAETGDNGVGRDEPEWSNPSTPTDRVLRIWR